MSMKIEHVLEELRLIEPPAAFTKQAHIKSREEYDLLYRESIDDPEGFWGKAAGELHWFKKWDRVLNEDNPPFYTWYEGGKI
ncbi:MAG: acetyl-coenzyme A synthetase N-terminal domain-containing protein, partial [Candidatus Hydrogenedentales bacterium]